MSSSQIRSFRHTATVIALEVETALCEVAAAVEKEAEIVSRQKEGERKRKATNKGRGANQKDLDGKAAEVRDRRTKLAEFIKEFVDGSVEEISLYYFDSDNDYAEYLSTAIGTLTQASVQNACVPSVFGSKNTLDISWMAHTYAILDGCFLIQQHQYDWKQSKLYLASMLKSTILVL